MLRLRSVFSKSLHVLVFVLFGLSLYAQNLLIVDHPGKSKRLRFRSGNTIHLIHGKHGLLSGEIISIRDSSLIVDHVSIGLNDIEGVIFNRRLVGTLSSFLKASGVAYIGLDIFNAAVNGDKPIVSLYTLAPPLAVIGGGYLLGAFAQKKYLRSAKYRFRILDTSP